MKKNLFMVAAVALMALVSCNKEELGNNTNEVVFTAEFEQDASTKTTLGEMGEKGRKAHWVAGDKIKINGVEFVAEADGAESSFTTTAQFAEASTYRAVYPAASYISTTAVNIPATQDGSFASASIAVAETSDHSLVFQNLSSILKFRVPVNCSKVTIESTASLAARITVNYTDGVMAPDYATVTQPSKTITVNGTFVPGTDYYVAVKPATHTLTVKIDGKVSKASTKSVPLNRSNIHNLGVLPEPKLSRDLKFSESNVSGTRGTDLSEPVLSGITEGVVYSSSNPEVATVDRATGNVTMLTKGTTEITAYAAESNTHAEASISYTLEVLPIYYNVYVCISDLKWSSVNMHRFTDDGDLTVWPGEALSETKDVNGKKYYKKEIEENSTLSFTYNNGSASSNFKIDVKDVTVDNDIYYRLSARGAIAVDPNDVKTFGYAIYVFDQKSKNVAPNLYAWDDGNAWNTRYGGNFAGWPGVAFKDDCYYIPADSNNWKHYYYYEIPTALYGKSFKFIVNKSGKTSDLSVTNLNGDLYVGYWYDSASSNGFWTNTNLNTPITQ